jgi:mRNA interferase HigB
MSLTGLGIVPNLGAWYCRGMRIIARRTLREFVATRAGHKDQRALRSALDAWFHEAQNAEWHSSAELKKLYATASIVSADRVVFNIKGNSYRLVVAIDYEKGIVWIKWLGTHKDYDQIDVTEVDHDD